MFDRHTCPLMSSKNTDKLTESIKFCTDKCELYLRDVKKPGCAIKVIAYRILEIEKKLDAISSNNKQ